MIGTAERLSCLDHGHRRHVPDRVMTNDELSELVDTTDEWIIERTGIRERRIAAPDEALSDICAPAPRAARSRGAASAGATST